MSTAAAAAAAPRFFVCLGAVVQAQGLWNCREEGKWVAVEARKMHREQGIRSVAFIACTVC